MGRLVHYTGNDIYDLLKNEILTLSLKPGQMISENEISSRFHVSRTPVHNAFTQLKKDGFVDIVPQKGTIVSLIDLDYIRQILYLRCCVEINIYIEAMDLCDDSFYRMLQNKIEEQRRITDNESETVKSFYEMTDEFHSAFYDILNKNKLWQTVSNLQNDYFRFRNLIMQSKTQRQKACEEHMLILEAVKNKNIEEVKRLVPIHLNSPLELNDIASYQEYFY